MSVTLATIAFKFFEHEGMICHNYDIVLIVIVCYTVIITVAIVELMQCIINYFVHIQIIDH